MGLPSFVAEFGLWDEAQQAAADRIESRLDEVVFVRVAYCDPHGLARSKTLTAEAFRTVLRNGMDFSPGPMIFDTGHAVAIDFLQENLAVGVREILGAGDFVLVPDPATFQVLPHVQPPTALVLGDEYLRDGSPHPLGVRSVLRRVVERYGAEGLSPVVGLEVEWYLTRLLPGPVGNEGNGFGRQGPAPAVEAVDAGYQFNLDDHTDALTGLTAPLWTLLLELGLPLRSLEHESGPGQFETTFSPMTALDAADAMLVFRTLAKQVCRRQGLHASFMTLPRLPSADPSGWHLHQSVMRARDGVNVLAGTSPADALSPAGVAYADALMATARELCLLSVPTVNGYRRLGPAFTLSPTVVNCSLEDRSAMLRISGAGSSAHVENRVGEPCANPYLLIAAQLRAGLEGLGAAPSRVPLPAAPVVLPQSLREALDVFRDSALARDLLGGPLQACLTLLKESEVSRFEAWCKEESPVPDDVTEWEQREYFGAY